MVTIPASDGPGDPTARLASPDLSGTRGGRRTSGSALRASLRSFVCFWGGGTLWADRSDAPHGHLSLSLCLGRGAAAPRPCRTTDPHGRCAARCARLRTDQYNRKLRCHIWFNICESRGPAHDSGSRGVSDAHVHADPTAQWHTRGCRHSAHWATGTAGLTRPMRAQQAPRLVGAVLLSRAAHPGRSSDVAHHDFRNGRRKDLRLAALLATCTAS